MDKSEIGIGEEPLKGLEPFQMRYRWVMLGLIWILYFTFGAVMSAVSPIITPILDDLGITYSEMGIILGAWQLTYVGVALVGGTVIDRWGIRKSLFVGILIVCLSAGIRYFADGFPLMFFAVALFGLGGPMISIGAPKTIATWFRGKDRSIAVGVYMTAPDVGRLIALSVTNTLIMPMTGYSWRLTFVTYSAMALVAALSWLFMARDTKAEGEGRSVGIIEVFVKIIKVRNVQLILMVGFLSMVVGHGYMTWLPNILEVGGLSPVMAGYGASLPVLAGIPAVLLVPQLTPPHLRSRIASIAALLGAGALYLTVITTGSGLIASLCIYGFVFRLAMPLFMLVLMDQPEVGSRYMGMAGGLYFCIAEIGGFLGPTVMGALVDWTGSFYTGMMLMVAVTAAMGIIALFVKCAPAQETQTT
jgi:cyanate permease